MAIWASTLWPKRLQMATRNAFALLQVKTIFAILLRGFSFELSHDPVIPENGLVMGPKKPFRVRYRRLRANGAF